MNIFSENTWEANEVGDKLSKQLFQTRSKKAKKPQTLGSINAKLAINDCNKKKSKRKRSNILKQDTIETDNNPNTLTKNKRKRKAVYIDNINNHQSNGTKKIKLQNQMKKPLNNAKYASHTETMSKQKVAGAMKKSNSKNKFKDNDNGKDKINVKRIQELLLMKKKNDKAHETKPETLRERMMTQLRASRFRFLNETLYNNESSESRKMFKEDPDAFNAYHTGYKQQVQQWPLNPLDIIIASIEKMPKDHIIADFGCGEARLAHSVEQKVHSLDLVAINDKVTACDMAHTPLLTDGVHVVVFCLSLMGTNLADYLLEANRVLKNNGILKIADIESRFDNIDEFINALASYGFKNTWKDLSHNLFYFMDFKKVAEVNRKNKKLPHIVLKSCLYKKR